MSDYETVGSNLQSDGLQSYFITASQGQGELQGEREEENEVISTISEGQILRGPVREGKKNMYITFLYSFVIFFSFKMKDLMFLQIVSGVWGH